MGRSGIDMEYRIMPSGDGHWYWEIVADENEVLKRGVSDTADAAAGDAKAARAAITDLHAPPRMTSKREPVHLRLNPCRWCPAMAHPRTRATALEDVPAQSAHEN